ncbi:uncharacterized protein LOC124522559 [Lynx rufus]|uniref:uncharacterized protein LOC124522559 n=1 Tax=Lynx rufus TaxID=61384 RepID=UPI001F1229E8|nr:uncharacterized protein LOC124522559 [Lynx rufus]
MAPTGQAEAATGETQICKNDQTPADCEGLPPPGSLRLDLIFRPKGKVHRSGRQKGPICFSTTDGVTLYKQQFTPYAVFWDFFFTLPCGLRIHSRSGSLALLHHRGPLRPTPTRDSGIRSVHGHLSCWQPCLHRCRDTRVPELSCRTAGRESIWKRPEQTSVRGSRSPPCCLTFSVVRLLNLRPSQSWAVVPVPVVLAFPWFRARLTISPCPSDRELPLL